MTTVADLNIKVDVDGAAEAAGELAVVGHAVDDVGDEAEGSAHKVETLSTAMSALKVAGLVTGLAGAAGGIGTLTSAAGGALAALGGAGVAVGGIAAIGVTMGVAATQALKLKYGVDSIGEAFDKLMKKGPIADAMKNLNAEFRKLGDGVEGFLLKVIPAAINIFSTLVKKVAPYMKQIGNAIADEAFQWADIFGKALDKILPHVADWTKRLSNILQPFFKSLIPAAVPGMRGLLTVLDGLADGLTAIVKAGRPLIGTVSQALAKGLRVLGEQLGRIVTAYGPSIKTFFDGLNVVFKGIAAALVGLAPGFQKGLAGFVEGLKELQPAMKPLGEAFGSLLAATAPLWPIIGKLAATLIETLAPIVKELAPIIGDFLAQALKLVAPLLEELATAAVELFEAIKPILPDIMDLVLIGLKAMNLTLPIAIKLLRLFIAILHGVVRVVRPVVHAVVGFAKDVMRWIRRGVQIAADWLGRLIGFFRELPGKIARAVAGAAHWLLDTGRDIVRGLWNGLKAIWQKAWDWMKEWGQKILDTIKDPLGLLYDIGRAIVQGLWNGLKSLWTSVSNWFTDRWNDLKETGREIFDFGSPSKVTRKWGQDIVRGLLIGLEDEWGGVNRSWARKMGGLRGPSLVGPGGRHGLGVGGGVKVHGTLAFNWRKGIADLEGAMVAAERSRGW